MSKLLENNLNRNDLGGYFQKNEPVNVTVRPEKNVEHFSVSLAKIVQVAKSFAENHTKICDADYQNLQELKLHIETLEKIYKPE